MCLWDSKERGGRPDIVRLVASIYREWNAEVVFITSNWGGNKELIEGCKKLDIPAFVSLFRSCSCHCVYKTFSFLCRGRFGTFDPMASFAASFADRFHILVTGTRPFPLGQEMPALLSVTFIPCYRGHKFAPHCILATTGLVLTHRTHLDLFVALPRNHMC
jgi:hypothetical protein